MARVWLEPNCELKINRYFKISVFGNVYKITYAIQMYFYNILKIEKHVPFSGVGLFTLVRNYVSQSMPDKFKSIF